MDAEERKAMLKQTFDTVAQGYDNPSLRFFLQSAKQMISLLDLRGNEIVLEVATGTGHAAMEISRYLTMGRVQGIDFSSGMLAMAEEKRDAMKIKNVKFSQMDMQALEFDDDYFDLAICSFCIFFVEDMTGLLRHIAAKVRRGGKILVTTFTRQLFAPLSDMFLERLESYGVEIPKFTQRRTASAEACRNLFRSAGLSNIQIYHKDMGFKIFTTAQWWEIIWNSGSRCLVEQLPDQRRQEFKAAHLEEVQALVDQGELRLEIKVLYTMGTKYGKI